MIIYSITETLGICSPYTKKRCMLYDQDAKYDVQRSDEMSRENWFNEEDRTAPKIIRLIKLGGLDWGDIWNSCGRKSRRKKHSQKISKKKDYFLDMIVDVKVILNWILKNMLQLFSLDLRISWERRVVGFGNTKMFFFLLSRSRSIRFQHRRKLKLSKRTLLHAVFESNFSFSFGTRNFGWKFKRLRFRFMH